MAGRQLLFERERAVSPRGANGAINRLRPEDAAAHDWYRFVLSYPPHLVRTYTERFGLGPADLVLDPFCGTGTTLVEAKKLGIPSQGIEALRMPHLAVSAKTDWTVDPAGLEQAADRVADRAERVLRRDGFSDTLLSSANGRHPLRKLPEASQKLLLANSISPLPLHKTLTLLEVMSEQADPAYSRTSAWRSPPLWSRMLGISASVPRWALAEFGTTRRLWLRGGAASSVWQGTFEGLPTAAT